MRWARGENIKRGRYKWGAGGKDAISAHDQDRYNSRRIPASSGYSLEAVFTWPAPVRKECRNMFIPGLDCTSRGITVFSIYRTNYEMYSIRSFPFMRIIVLRWSACVTQSGFHFRIDSA